MGVYSVDGEPRFKFCSSVFGISLILSIIINYYLTSHAYFNSNLIIQSFLTISPTFICALLLKYTPNKIVLYLVGIPDLTGVYSGHLITNYDNCKKIECSITINQSLFSISISLKTDTSYSKNTSAHLKVDGDSVSLIYTYHNDGKCIDKQLNQHYGTCIATITSDCFDGRYYNDGSRQTNGEIKLKKQS